MLNIKKKILLVVALGILCFSFATIVYAADAPTQTSKALTFTPNVPIPGFSAQKEVDNTLFARYVSAFYIFFSGVAGIIAVIMIMWGGFHYIVSAGNSQKMSQGKEIINNAIIGLILLFTSYLLLNLINPNLTRLALPSLTVIRQQAVPGYYCESMGQTSAAMQAATQQGARCGAIVKYKDESNQEKSCISLAVDADEQSNEIACFPTTVTTGGETKTEYRRLNALSVCEDNKYTQDDACTETQAILSYQPWLKGGCIKADIGAGKDTCQYFNYFSCSSDYAQPVACTAAGTTGTTTCWRDGKPRSAATSIGDEHFLAHCTSPTSTGKAVSFVQSLCCSTNKKSLTVCAADGCQKNEVAVSCNTLNAQPGNYKTRGNITAGPTCGQAGTTCCTPLQLQYGPGQNDVAPGL